MSARPRWLRWAPAMVLGIGALCTVGIDGQHRLPLRQPLATVVPDTLVGSSGRDLHLSERERDAAGATEYLLRMYDAGPDVPNAASFSLYVAFYDRQLQGKSIHSPKNCLPGNGWEPIRSDIVPIETATGRVAVNRYLLRGQSGLALVLYWYQGRGRVRASEYLVKWDLLRDAALRHRTDEALVRLVVPVRQEAEGQQPFETAAAVARRVIPMLEDALPQ